MLHSVFLLSLLSSTALAQLCKSNLQTYVGSLELPTAFSPVKNDHQTGLPRHHRTPFAVSPDGKSAYLAYLDASGKGVHVQQIDPVNFQAIGDAVTVSCGREAGGLVAHNDGFALLTNEPMPPGTPNAPPENNPVAVLYRWTRGKRTFKRFLGGPDFVNETGALCSPYMHGDLAYSQDTGLYGAYFVVSGYDGPAKGYFGDSIQYVNDNGTIERIQGATSNWGCSTNTGIALAASSSAPFASVCADDEGGIWLNTGGTGMQNSGGKVSNEYARHGAANEPMGGVSGSYSNLARFINKESYIFTWVSRGAKDMTENKRLGKGYTTSRYRRKNRNVAIATFSDKKTMVGKQATGEPGPDGDSHVNWITTGSSDCQNARVATFDGSNALVTWEEIAEPTCNHSAMGCEGEYTGTYFQLIRDGQKVGEPIESKNVYVAGDMVTMVDGRICWPYVDMDWSLNGLLGGLFGSLFGGQKTCSSISFACISLGGSAEPEPSPPVAPAPPVNPPTYPAPPVDQAPPTAPAPPTDQAPPANPSPPAYSAPPAAPPAAPPVPSLSFSLFNPSPTPGNDYLPEPIPVPAPTPKPTPIRDDRPNPYESVYIPASLSFNPSLAPAFTNILPGLPGEFTLPGPVYPTPAPCGGGNNNYNGGAGGQYNGPVYPAGAGPAYGGGSPCTLETRVRPSPTNGPTY